MAVNISTQKHCVYICAAAILAFQLKILMRVPVWLCVYPLTVQRAILMALGQAAQKTA
jgi:hypothetical protein